MSNPIARDELADLIVETGKHHHKAFITSDGEDPEWALWYAAYLQTRLWDRLGSIPTRSSLVHLLIQGDQDFAPTPEAPDWPHAYADLFIANLSSPS
jgi:hypothetical protein